MTTLRKKKSSKKGRQQEHNLQTGKYRKQEARTARNKIRRITRALKTSPSSRMLLERLEHWENKKYGI